MRSTEGILALSHDIEWHVDGCRLLCMKPSVYTNPSAKEWVACTRAITILIFRKENPLCANPRYRQHMNLRTRWFCCTEIADLPIKITEIRSKYVKCWTSFLSWAIKTVHFPLSNIFTSQSLPFLTYLFQKDNRARSGRLHGRQNFYHFPCNSLSATFVFTFPLSQPNPSLQCLFLFLLCQKTKNVNSVYKHEFCSSRFWNQSQ